MVNVNPSIGFVVDDLAANQIAYTLLVNINAFLSKNAHIPVSLFFLENSQPCLNVTTSRYHAKDAVHFNGHLIATSPRSADIIKDIYLPKRYYYIYDIVRCLKNPVALKDKSIVKFTRCKDYIDVLDKSGVEVRPEVVKDFDINTIVKAILWQKQN